MGFILVATYRIFALVLILAIINGFVFHSQTTQSAHKKWISGSRLQDSSQQQQSLKVLKRNDTVIEKIAIFSLSLLLSSISPDPLKSLSKSGFSYSNFVDCSKILLEFQTPDIIKTKIVSLIVRILPSFVRDYFKTKYRETPRLVAELSVRWFEFGFLHWLVGPVEPKYTSTGRADETGSSWNNTVKLLECRFLRESGCKAACNLLCKRPTQSLFQEHLGLPLYMRPNFTDYSCEMIFGIDPPLDSQDEAFSETCYSQCALTACGSGPIITCAKATETLIHTRSSSKF
jgi:hypothetical protein